MRVGTGFLLNHNFEEICGGVYSFNTGVVVRLIGKSVFAAKILIFSGDYYRFSDDCDGDALFFLRSTVGYD